MENGVKNDIQQAYDLLMSQEDPLFILAFESSEERGRTLANGKAESILALYLSIAEGLYKEVGCDSMSEFLIKLASAAECAEMETENAN